MTYDRFSNFRTRRNLLLQPHQPNNPPFVIRVPYSKIVAGNPIFTHSVAWKAKPARAKNDDVKQQNERDPQLSPESEQLQQSQQQRQSTPASPPSSDVEISQFHSQDTNGQVVFGFNSPDQMRIETRNADGTVHGTYSYLDPTGQVIKVFLIFLFSSYFFFYRFSISGDSIVIENNTHHYLFS